MAIIRKTAKDYRKTLRKLTRRPHQTTAFISRSRSCARSTPKRFGNSEDCKACATRTCSPPLFLLRSPPLAARPYAGLVEIAGAYLFYLCRNHPFLDGNKRTAMMAGVIFLRLNGIDPTPDSEQWEN